MKLVKKENSYTKCELTWMVENDNGEQRAFTMSYFDQSAIPKFLDYFAQEGWHVRSTIVSEVFDVEKVEEPTVFIHSETGPEDEEEKK